MATANAPAVLERCLSFASCNTSTTIGPKSALACRPDRSPMTRTRAPCLFPRRTNEEAMGTKDPAIKTFQRQQRNRPALSWTRCSLQSRNHFLSRSASSFHLAPNLAWGAQSSTAVANRPGDIAGVSRFNSGRQTTVEHQQQFFQRSVGLLMNATEAGAAGRDIHKRGEASGMG